MLIVDVENLSVGTIVLSSTLDNILIYLNCLLLFKHEHVMYSSIRWLVLQNNKIQTIYLHQLAKAEIL